MCRIVLLFFLMVCPSSILFAQCKGGVDGTVIDELGNPMKGALVSLVEKVPFSGHRPIRTFVTDSKGAFHATIDVAGKYLVLAKKEDQGYPETRVAFYSNLEAQELVLDCSSPRVGLVVRLGPKAGHIRQISVIDAATGKLIPNASITLRRVSNENLFITTSTTYKNIAVPSDTTVTYQVTAPGYADSPKMQLHLAPSEDMDLEIRLNQVP
jgi:hypothetical protein